MARGDGAYTHYGYDAAHRYVVDLLLDDEDVLPDGTPDERVAEVHRMLNDGEVSESTWEIAWDAVWDNVRCDVAELMGRVQDKAGHRSGYWLADVQNFGWRHVSGESDAFFAEKAEDLLRRVLPNTDNDFYVFDHGDRIAIDNAHHDAPTGGEIYSIAPVSEYTVWEVFPGGDTNGYGETERVWAEGVWATSAADAIERCFGDNRSHEPLYRRVTSGSGDTATGEGYGGYPEEAWFAVRAERS